MRLECELFASQTEQIQKGPQIRICGSLLFCRAKLLVGFSCYKLAPNYVEAD